MGKTYVFECGLCHYRAKVSGGADSGVDCEVQTIACRDCRELFDVFRRARGQAAPVGKFKSGSPEIPPVALPGSRVFMNEAAQVLFGSRTPPLAST